MLQSHAKMEHDRYLEAREAIVTRVCSFLHCMHVSQILSRKAEAAQEELLKREAVLAAKEAAHKQHLEEREVLHPDARLPRCTLTVCHSGVVEEVSEGVETQSQFVCCQPVSIQQVTFPAIEVLPRGSLPII